MLLGATGFVGRLTAADLAAHAPAGTRIALAGRSRSKLGELQRDLGSAAAHWPLVEVDVTDPAGLDRLAATTRVLLSTVGPYARHGLAVVEACVNHGIDYADLTGETLFARRSIDAFHERAQQTGARIVHSCGFDSVPSDLGVGLAAARADAEEEGTLTETVLHVRELRGGFSGGTIDSLRQQLIEMDGDVELRRMAADPRALAPADAVPRAGGRKHSGSPLRRDRRTGRWQAPFAMGGYNRQVVLRSDALHNHRYGDDFTYREAVDTGRGPLGAVAAAAVLAGTTVLFAGMSTAPTRKLLHQILPAPGEGPSERTLAAGRFAVEVDATTTTGARYRTTFSAPHDPGYGGTAVMLAESGLALLDDDRPDRAAGVLTPMTALGETLARRLRERGFVVHTERLP